MIEDVEVLSYSRINFGPCFAYMEDNTYLTITIRTSGVGNDCAGERVRRYFPAMCPVRCDWAMMSLLAYNL